jgi:putative membrane protein insertion efficiency factor
MKKILLIVLRGYQLLLSPVLGSRCRFYPSCSNYAMQAIREHGTAAGSMMSFKRICKCHPFHHGGYDPVPEPSNQNNS